MWKKVLTLAILALIYPVVESQKKKSGENPITFTAYIQFITSFLELG